MAEPERSEAREVNPFYKLTPGGDTEGRDGRLVFSDFRPNAVPSDTEEAAPAPDPKEGSAPASAPSPESETPTEPTGSGEPAQTPAHSETGNPSYEGDNPGNS